MLALLIGLGAAGRVQAEETPAQAMARAIARMMESMGFNEIGTPGAANPGHGVPPGWPSVFGPWSGAMNPSPSTSEMSRMADKVYQGVMSSGEQLAAGWTPGLVEGVWEDNQGGLLIVQGTLYRLYSACNGHIDGEIRVLGDRIELSNRQQNFTQTFEYALDQGRLALRDPSGQIYLYRRLLLDREK
ncbi:hypothetical protein D779_2693 [Imhoffiella purpurea]|uniref:Uncharacterized protein n=2 Tax=Imhoffiella purpurea TaxID=1249627 RepID=W9VET2_9GAMM|nr:hypothetical protein D779_2693 [Imhoffiella purpurea]